VNQGESPPAMVPLPLRHNGEYLLTENNHMSKYTKQLRDKRAALLIRQSALMTPGKELSGNDRLEFRNLQNQLEETDAQLVKALDKNAYGVADAMPGNGRPAMSKKIAKRAANIQGRPGEAIPVGCMTAWYERACANGVFRNQGTDRDWNRAFGEMAGFAKPTMESRTLLEDTTGSGAALSINQYLPQAIDVLLPQTIMGQLGFNVIPMDREFCQIPVFTSTYAGPQWIAEAGNLSLDAGPAFAPLLLTASGGWKFYTAVSLELAQEAFLAGGLDLWLAGAAAKKLAVALDTSMLMGVAGMVGAPGLNNENLFAIRKQTGDSGSTGLAPVDTQELSVIAELAIKKYIDVSEIAYISNVGVHEAYTRIPLSTYGKYFDIPNLVAKVPWVMSENSALSYTETDSTTPAQTGGSYSSIYAGPFSRFGYLGIRMDLASSAMKLDQRLIDQGLIGFFSMFRGSLRFAHPETFSRTVGVITK
jgi:hypothetical protein